MPSDEQRVRTMAGWIGVEISRSRVRTEGKAGYGLYRVRRKPWSADLPEDLDEMWTAYAFGLGVIDAAVRNSIGQGTPAGPLALHLVEDATAVRTGEGGYAAMRVVPTRWTQVYRGRRDLGRMARAGLCGRPERHEDGCVCLADGKARWAGHWSTLIGGPVGRAECGCPNNALGQAPVIHRCVLCGFEGGYESVHEDCAGCRETARSRQRAGNAAFQAEHLERRAYGLKARYAGKAARQRNGEQRSE